MLLDGARQGVQVARPGVAGQRGPGGKRLACGRDGAVHVRLAGLRDARQPGRGGGLMTSNPASLFPLVQRPPMNSPNAPFCRAIHSRAGLSLSGAGP